MINVRHGANRPLEAMMLSYAFHELIVESEKCWNGKKKNGVSIFNAYCHYNIYNKYVNT